MIDYVKKNSDMLLLISGTIPLTYQYLTGLTLPYLVFGCSVAAAIALEVVLVKQIQQPNINFYNTAAILISTVFLILISFATYLPSGLHSAGVLTEQRYGIINAWLESVIHSVFALLILCVSMSKRHDNKGINKHIAQYTADAKNNFVCDVCGKVFKTEASLKVHKGKVHKNKDKNKDENKDV